MKTAGKRFILFGIAVLMVLGVLAGCGNDTSTPAGTLQATLSAMKDGNFKQLGELTGEDFEKGDWEGIPAREMQRLFRAMFGNLSVQVRQKESDGESAVVSVTGETGDLSSVITQVGNEASSDFMAWCEENQERLLEIDSEEMRREMMARIVASFEKYKGKMDKKSVDVQIQMVKTVDGKWIVDPESADDMALVVFGMDGVPTMQTLLGNLV